MKSAIYSWINIKYSIQIASKKAQDLQRPFIKGLEKLRFDWKSLQAG